ncbi:MAG TPA: hypothetical protein DDY88_05735 [Actinobacteria bacterium]|nr:hypothetical protein [Actinomycetota bacterium]
MTELAPTAEDPLLAQNSELIGGAAGAHRRSHRRWWTPLRVLIVLTGLSYSLGIWLGSSCRSSGWISPERYEHLCYTDIHPFYSLQGLAQGAVPYVDLSASHQGVDAPVLVGMFMEVSALLTRWLSALRPQADVATLFFDVNVVLLLLPLLIAVIATALAERNRPWDAAMVALAPIIILASRINWDLLAVALVALAMLQLSRSRNLSAGVLLGAAMSAAHYPVVILFGLVLLAFRTKQWQAAGRIVLSALIAWLAINVPFMVINVEGWAAIYRKVIDSAPDLGSVWFAIGQWGGPQLTAGQASLAALFLFLAALAGIAAVVMQAPQPPRAVSVIFLVLAAYVVTAKGFAPQFGLWLIPLAVLARPRWRDFLIWQAAEVVYFVSVWWFLAGYQIDGAKGMTSQWYALATLVHIAGTAFFAVMVIRDIRRPPDDPVRTTSPDRERHQSAMW